MQPLGATVASAETLLEFARGGAAARVDFTAVPQPSLGEADHNPAKQAQGKSRFGVAHTAAVFAEGNVQSMVQAAFDGPIASLEFEQASRIQLFQREAGDEINNFSSFFALAADAPTEPGDALNSGKAHLLGRSRLAIQHPDFASPAVVLPRQGMGLRRGLRGKNAVV